MQFESHRRAPIARAFSSSDWNQHFGRGLRRETLAPNKAEYLQEQLAPNAANVSAGQGCCKMREAQKERKMQCPPWKPR